LQKVAWAETLDDILNGIFSQGQAMSHRVALITGASKRAGRTIAERFAREGYDVVVHYGVSESDAADVVSAIQAIGRVAIALKANLQSPKEIDALIAGVYDKFGRLDVLVNNAAIFFPDHLGTFNVGDLDSAWEVNCRAPILLTRAFYNQAKVRNQTGLVVNVVDQKVQDNFHPDDFSYTVGKAALGNLTKMLAMSAMDVLRVNAIYPGLMNQSGDQTEEDFEYAAKHATLLGHVAGPDDIADAIILLTLPSINGVDFVVDAGQNLKPVPRDVINLYRAS
jgi:pteridine reductase